MTGYHFPLGNLSQSFEFQNVRFFKQHPLRPDFVSFLLLELENCSFVPIFPIFGLFWGCPDFDLAWVKALRMGALVSYIGFYRNIGGIPGLAFASWPPPPSPLALPPPFPWRGHQCPHFGMRHIIVIDPAKNPRPAKQFIALNISIQVGIWWQCCWEGWAYGRWPLPTN